MKGRANRYGGGISASEFAQVIAYRLYVQDSLEGVVHDGVLV